MRVAQTPGDDGDYLSPRTSTHGGLSPFLTPAAAASAAATGESTANESMSSRPATMSSTQRQWTPATGSTRPGGVPPLAIHSLLQRPPASVAITIRPTTLEVESGASPRDYPLSSARAARAAAPSAHPAPPPRPCRLRLWAPAYGVPLVLWLATIGVALYAHFNDDADLFFFSPDDPSVQYGWVHVGWALNWVALAVYLLLVGLLWRRRTPYTSAHGLGTLILVSLQALAAVCHSNALLAKHVVDPASNWRAGVVQLEWLALALQLLTFLSLLWHAPCHDPAPLVKRLNAWTNLELLAVLRHVQAEVGVVQALQSSQLMQGGRLNKEQRAQFQTMQIRGSPESEHRHLVTHAPAAVGTTLSPSSVVTQHAQTMKLLNRSHHRQLSGDSGTTSSAAAMALGNPASPTLMQTPMLTTMLASNTASTATPFEGAPQQQPLPSVKRTSSRSTVSHRHPSVERRRSGERRSGGGGGVFFDPVIAATTSAALSVASSGLDSVRAGKSGNLGSNPLTMELAKAASAARAQDEVNNTVQSMQASRTSQQDTLTTLLPLAGSSGDARDKLPTGSRRQHRRTKSSRDSARKTSRRRSTRASNGVHSIGGTSTGDFFDQARAQLAQLRQQEEQQQQQQLQLSQPAQRPSFSALPPQHPLGHPSPPPTVERTDEDDDISLPDEQTCTQPQHVSSDSGRARGQGWV